MAIDFGKQIGPLPLGAWIAAVGGGLYFMYSRKNSSSDTTSTDTSTDNTDVSGGVGTGASSEWVDVNPPDGSSSSGPTYQTNEAWGTAAINWLIAQGYDPGVSNSAITKALNGGVDSSGNKMSVTEWSLWSLAIQHLGSPPYPVSVPPPTTGVGTPVGNPPSGPTKGGGPVTTKPPPVVVKPVPKPTTTKTPRYHTVIVKRGDTLSGIAKRYGTTWQTIWNFNLKYRSSSAVATLKKRGPNTLYAGETIWVPY